MGIELHGHFGGSRTYVRAYLLCGSSSVKRMTQLLVKDRGHFRQWLLQFYCVKPGTSMHLIITIFTKNQVYTRSLWQPCA